MSSYGTARPSTERDTLHSLNGIPIFLGVIQSTGSTSANNATTSTGAFNVGTGVPPSAVVQSVSPQSFVGTLAGKTLLIQPTGPGFFLPSGSAALNITNQSLPIGSNLVPGVELSDGERMQVMMSPTSGWLQWLAAPSSNLYVWELI